MIRLKRAVIVEGKYDKIKLSSFLDAVILETNGFTIFKDKEKMELIRRLATTVGIVILTDSDAAGFQIRSFIKGAVQGGDIVNAYIPDILGKERRKDAPSKEGKLGVEGMPVSYLMRALELAGVEFEAEESVVPPEGKQRKISKTDLYMDGLSGSDQSKARRLALLKKLRLPERLTPNAMLDMLNAMYTYEEYKAAVAALPVL